MDRGTLQHRPRILFASIAGLIATVGFAGCDKKSGSAMVLEKEHIAAKEITSTPGAHESLTPSSPSPTPGTNGVVLSEDATPRELAEDEIVVDTYVMKKDARGTGRDPRAMTDEQWIVRVQMEADLRRIKVQTDKTHWEKLKIGDRINVSYRQGKYTGTVWAAEIQ
jgi:hypothetical protein